MDKIVDVINVEVPIRVDNMVSLSVVHCILLIMVSVPMEVDVDG